MEENINDKSYKIKIIVENIVFYAILIPLLFVTLMVVYQSIFIPDEIPNVFGYKVFIILDEYMDETVKFGDLAITHNIEPNTLKNSDVIAFRNGVNTVTIHKITDIKEEKMLDIKTNEYYDTRVFTMQTLKNETSDTKHVKSESVEGILVHKIPKIGAIIYVIQKPINIIIICSIIVAIGTIAYFIAKRLDEKELKELEAKQSQSNN